MNKRIKRFKRQMNDDYGRAMYDMVSVETINFLAREFKPYVHLVYMQYVVNNDAFVLGESELEKRCSLNRKTVRKANRCLRMLGLIEAKSLRRGEDGKFTHVRTTDYSVNASSKVLGGLMQGEPWEAIFSPEELADLNDCKPSRTKMGEDNHGYHVPKEGAVGYPIPTVKEGDHGYHVPDTVGTAYPEPWVPRGPYNQSINTRVHISEYSNGESTDDGSVAVIDEHLQQQRSSPSPSPSFDDDISTPSTRYGEERSDEGFSKDSHDISDCLYKNISDCSHEKGEKVDAFDEQVLNGETYVDVGAVGFYHSPASEELALRNEALQKEEQDRIDQENANRFLAKMSEAK